MIAVRFQRIATFGTVAKEDKMGYNHGDETEGQDCFKKMAVASKYAAYGGVAFASFDVILVSHPQGFAKTAGRFAYIVGPLVGMAATWAGTICLAASLRKKDDGWNYVLGGIGASTVFGAWRKNFGKGAAAALVLSGLSYAAYVSKKNNVPFFNMPEQKVWGTYDHCSPKNDWSIRGYLRKE